MPSDSSSCKFGICRWSGGSFDYFDRSDASEPSEDDEKTMASAFIESLQEKTAEAFYVKSLYGCRQEVRNWCRHVPTVRFPSP
jgi:hypothetical protein